MDFLMAKMFPSFSSYCACQSDPSRLTPNDGNIFPKLKPPGFPDPSSYWNP